MYLPGWGRQEDYRITSSGVNQYGDRYDHPYFPGSGRHGYHYSNRDGSYHYLNPDGSRYYHAPPPRDYARYIPPSHSTDQNYFVHSEGITSLPTRQGAWYPRDESSPYYRPSGILSDSALRSYPSSPTNPGYHSDHRYSIPDRPIYYETPDGLKYFHGRYSRPAVISADGSTHDPHYSDEDPSPREDFTSRGSSSRTYSDGTPISYSGIYSGRGHPLSRTSPVYAPSSSTGGLIYRSAMPHTTGYYREPSPEDDSSSDESLAHRRACPVVYDDEDENPSQEYENGPYHRDDNRQSYSPDEYEDDDRRFGGDGEDEEYSDDDDDDYGNSSSSS